MSRITANRWKIAKSALWAVVVCLGVGGCLRASAPIGLPLPTHFRFETELKNYGRLEPNKAIAVAGDTSGLYVSGYAFGHASEMAAIEAAMQACEARRSDRRITAPCSTYAVGDHPVATASSSSSLFR